MMKAYIHLTVSQLRVFARNKQVLFWTLMFPVFLMVMLGSFVGGGGGVSYSGALINLDKSTQSTELTEALLKLETVKFDSDRTEEEALEALKNGDLELVVVIPEGYGDSLSTGTSPAEIKAVYDQTKTMQSEIALLALSQTVDSLSKAIVQYEPVVVVKSEGVQSLELEYIDFLVPGIVAMMIMSNNLNGVAGQIASWRERGILRRMQSTPLQASTFIAGQITARLVLNGLQATVVLLIASLIFGTQVNGSWALLMLFVILGTLTFMAIGFIIAGVAKSPESAGPIAGFISFPLLFLGGVFFPISNMPEVIQPYVKLLPISHLSTALRQVMNVGADLSVLWFDALLLSGWMIVAFIIASFTFKWE
jgi:ABC-2 type transport system permease protein